MTFIVPFMYQPFDRPEDEAYLVYSVNNDDPENESGYMQGYWKCTHCGEGSQFRFYDDDHHPEYEAKCPKCRKEFIAIDDTDYDED
jgi:hypothetical protein